MADTIIPYLPERLRLVPAGPRSADDPEGDDRRATFAGWHHQVARYRALRHAELNAYPEFVAIELHRCSQDFAYWLATYATIFEPRDDRTNLGGGDLPFIPFAKQVEFARFLLWSLSQSGPNADTVTSKTRDVGASWIVCALALWGWLFKSPWNVLLISRKEELVDSKNQKSLFAKIDRMYWNLPTWMQPAGYNPDKHRLKNYMFNPVTYNEIGGEATTSKSGRGDRATWAAFDEAGFIPGLFDIWNGISTTTGHRWAISTENLDDGPDFYNLRTGTDMEYRPALFELDWWDNPLNSAQYAEVERQRMASRPSDFEREIMRNPHTASSLVYGKLHDPLYEPDPMRNTPDPMAATYVSCDPGQLDDTAFVVLQENPATLEVTVLDSYQNKGKDADFYGTLLAVEPDEEKFPGYYGPREWDFMELLRAIPAPTYCGDPYGDTSNGVTLETFYSVIGKYENPQGERIYINRNRAGQKDRGMYVRARNTYKGRQQSVHEFIPHFRFAARPGAIFALKCLRSHRFKPDDRPTMSEPTKALHDWTSHVAQAVEFWAVHMKTRAKALENNDAMVENAHRGARRSSTVRLFTPSVQAKRASLYRKQAA